jgi:hypothetical protein
VLLFSIGKRKEYIFAEKENSWNAVEFARWKKKMH